MIVSVNGEPRELSDQATVAGLVAELGAPGVDGRGIAVAVGGEVVPRTRWAGHSLCEGDAVEVLTAVQGG